jgi:type II secretory pathway pseudopilin PulG
MRKIPIRHSSSGFSLIESLICLSLFLFILVASLEFLISARNHFFDLRNEQEINQAAYATLDKIRLDLCECGRGLIVPQRLGLIDAIQATDTTLIIQSKDMDILPEKDLVAGQTFIPIASTSGIKKGQKICFTDLEKGDIKTIISVDTQGLAISTPLNFSYGKDEAAVFLIRTVSIFLDSGRRILRRKVNASSAQPLLEDVFAFNVFYEETSNIVSLGLILNMKEEKEYETFIFPKNMALVSIQ